MLNSFQVLLNRKNGAIGNRSEKLYAGCKLALNTAAGYIIPKNTIPIG
jgi:hypothetical protein